MNEALTAFLMGLFGGVHCLGMCGSLVSILSLAQKDTWQIPFGYHLGRISSYVLAGILFGSLGLIFHAEPWRWALSALSALFMLALGLYLGGWWSGLSRIEQLGGHLWVRIEPLGRRLLPVQNFRHALLLGMIWGWLPCGLVYSALIFAFSAGQIEKGALIMLAFALGTLPNLILIGQAAQQIKLLLQKKSTRRWAGTMVILLAIFNLWFIKT